MSKATKGELTKPDEKMRFKVLVVDDDRSFRLMLQETLNDLGGFSIDKSFALDAKTGMEQFQEIKPDIVLLDINLPDGKGLDLIQPMLKIHPGVGIVMVTGSRLSTDVSIAKERGAIGYILKPYTRRKIEDALYAFINYRKQLEAMGKDISPEAKIEVKPAEFFVGEEAEPKKSPILQVLSEWNVLFADSYLTNIENAERRLRKLCKQLDVAATADEFLSQTEKNEYQCVLIDPTLSNNNGYQLANELRQRYRQRAIRPYIIALMPNRDELDKKKWLQAGMHDFLVKPCSFKDIEDKLHKFAQTYLEESSEDYCP